ncbi:hypothetical protein ASZ90_002333 [hydrocarbon metagenome]|uniref:Uncharacterized protein n=1 Tax=hydrocarbon metagenome TaxID=938273 RepID=A0A0W8G3S8_9ZZZZ
MHHALDFLRSHRHPPVPWLKRIAKVGETYTPGKRISMPFR